MQRRSQDLHEEVIPTCQGVILQKVIQDPVYFFVISLQEKYLEKFIEVCSKQLFVELWSWKASEKKNDSKVCGEIAFHIPEIFEVFYVILGCKQDEYLMLFYKESKA